MNIRRLPSYAKACLRALVSNGPRDYLRMLSRSPYTVRDLPRYGMSMLVDVRDPAISKPILALGDYEEAFARRLMSRVREDTHFLDVGANIGFFTLAVAARAVRGRVWSVEPDPCNLRLLRASVALNGFEDRVAVHAAAASDAPGEVFLSTLGADANLGARFTARDAATLLGRTPPGAAAPVRVPAVTVDALVGDARVDLVKIDVEGHEPLVFAGMRGVLRRQRPVIFCEFAPGTIRHITGADPAAMLRGILDCGYSVAVVDDAGDVRSVGGDVDGFVAGFDAHRHHVDLVLEPEGGARP